MTYTVTQADRRAGEMWRSSYGRAGSFQDLLEAFARHRIETLERAAEAHAEAFTAKDAEIARLREALVQHNDRLRSAASVAAREGAETNWLTFRGAVTYTLAEYHELANEARQALGASHDA